MNNSPTDIDMEDCSHRGTAVWIKLLSKQRVLAAGKERACSGNETLNYNCALNTQQGGYVRITSLIVVIIIIINCLLN